MSKPTSDVSRRDFMQGLAACLSGGAVEMAWASPARKKQRALVLLELKGGNDDLNAFPPYRDPAYAAARPSLAVPAAEVIPVSDDRGLHPALAPMVDAWEANELGFIQGVGYPSPDLSHFTSGLFWETGQPGNHAARAGWLSEVARHAGLAPSPSHFDAVVVDLHAGPLAQSPLNVLHLNQPRGLVSHSTTRSLPTRNDTQQALMRTWREWASAKADLSSIAADLGGVESRYPDSRLGQSLALVHGLLRRPDPPGFFRIRLAGFDTHHGQARQHAKVLDHLATALQAFRRGLMGDGLWNSTLTFAYSEFGRRIRENGNLGTDHGTAGTAFVLGGRARGGWHGTRPDLERPDEQGNQVYTMDFRRIYAALMDQWSGLSVPPMFLDPSMRGDALQIVRADAT